MESDGRIRSKDIGTGEVNSRALDNIRSSNYNGSHTNPEIDSGTQGWQILKSGFAVFNDAIFRGTIAAARIVSAIISGGEVNITSGGRLTVGEVEDPLVVLDEAGLRVDGGNVQAVWADTDVTVVDDASLDTTFAEIISITIDPPDWVEVLAVLAFGLTRDSNTSGANRNVESRVTIDDGGASATILDTGHTSAHNWSVAYTLPHSAIVPLSPAGRAVTTTLDARVNTGTGTENEFSLTVMALGFRTGFA